MTDDQGLSRRRFLAQTGAAAASAAAVTAMGADAGVESKRKSTKNGTARKFCAWISRGTGKGRTTLQEVTLRPIAGRQIVVRTEASSLCYSNCGAVLGYTMNFGAPPPPPAGAASNVTPPPTPAERMSKMAVVQGHGGIGVVEAVGPEVRRVQVGDRVCVSGTPQCGSCYPCLRGRADMCQFGARIGPDDLLPIGDLKDGSPVYMNSQIGGLGELMVSTEEWVVPIFTKASSVDLGMVTSCVSVAGLGATVSQVLALVEPGSTVAVVGCGPLGLSAVQGARIAGASTIIAIDPIRARREVAQKVGATTVLDPNAEGDKLVNTVRELSRGPNNRLWSGGRDSGSLLAAAGADFVIEAAGADWVPSKWEQSPDPTGVLAIRNAYEMCAAGGHIVTTSLARGPVNIPAIFFNIGGRTHHAGQAGGANPMRDIPRFVELLDKGQYDAKSLATTVVPMEKALEAYEEVLYRTTITAIMTV